MYCFVLYDHVLYHCFILKLSIYMHVFSSCNNMYALHMHTHAIACLPSVLHAYLMHTPGTTHIVMFLQIQWVEKVIDCLKYIFIFVNTSLQKCIHDLINMLIQVHFYFKKTNPSLNSFE